jgi:hypothetical protein
LIIGALAGTVDAVSLVLFDEQSGQAAERVYQTSNYGR